MDEMRLKLSTKFMRGIAGKLMAKTISKKLGCDITLELNEIEITTMGDKILVHANVDGELSKDDFVSILKKNDLE